MPVSNYLANKIMRHLTNLESFTVPTTLYIGLATAPVLGTHTGGTVPESTYTGYTRVAIPGWATTANPGESSTNAVINFPPCTGGSQALTHFFVADASSGGNLWVSGTIPNGGYTVSNGMTPQIPMNAVLLKVGP